MNTITVKVRHIEETWEDAKPLGEFSPDALDELVDTMSRWGVATNGGDTSMAVAGQFVVTQTGTWFDVMVGDDD